jgi:redox-sensitive bicupin YhaK (pirin superfamily)
VNPFDYLPGFSVTITPCQGKGNEIQVTAGGNGVCFLCRSGNPINEPVVSYGPIVMNTEKELRTAFAELRDGTFIRKE